jgi:hypothetical protein
MTSIPETWFLQSSTAGLLITVSCLPISPLPCKLPDFPDLPGTIRGNNISMSGSINQQTIPMYLHNNNKPMDPENNIFQDQKIRDSFELDKVDFRRYSKRNITVILAQSDLLSSSEVYVFLRKNFLVIETPMTTQLEHPFRMHLIGKDIQGEFERGITDILFTEIKLNRKYGYHIISSGLVRPGLLKVVLKTTRT